jgi:hypothetical protein
MVQTAIHVKYNAGAETRLGRLGVTLFGMIGSQSRHSPERAPSAAASGLAAAAWRRAARLMIRSAAL